MKFIVDVCAGIAVAKWLDAHGHNVVSVRDRDRHMSDDEIIAWASMERRVIITADKDFGYLAVRMDLSHAGILLLPNVPDKQRLELVASVLRHYASDLESSAIVTVRGKRVRVRR